MMIIHLFLPDFRGVVRNKKFAEENVHPVFYYADDVAIYFYKPVGYVIYKTTIFTDNESLKLLPKDMTITGFKQEFDAVEIPRKPDEPLAITGTIQ